MFEPLGAATPTPGDLDACLQVAGALLHGSAAPADVYLPVSISRLFVAAPFDGPVRLDVRVRSSAASEAIVDVAGWTEDGRAVMEMAGAHFRKATRFGERHASQIALQMVSWQPASPVPAAAAGRNWIILSGSDDARARLAVELRQSGSMVDVLALEALPADADARATALAEDLRRALGALPEPRGVLYLAPGVDATIASASDGPAGHATRAVQDVVTVAAGAAAGGVSRLLIATKGGVALHGGDVTLSDAPLWGLARVIGLEHPELHTACVDLDPDVGGAGCALLLDELVHESAERETAWRHGERLAPRLAPFELVPQGTPRRLVKGQTATLDELTWEPIATRAPEDGEVELRVHAAGLNFRDVLNALGLYPGEPVPLGNECAGEVVRVGAGVTHLQPGDLAMGIAFGSLATHITTPAALFVRKPAVLTFAQAAAAPIAYLTAECCLVDAAALGAGERVLVHAAAGGVGLAAVAIAKRLGATVVATAGNPAKRRFVAGLGVDHVFDSRSPAFAEDVTAALGPRPIDVVLNSLSGEFITNSVGLLAPGGRFTEIGKRGIWTADEMRAARPDVRYDIVYLGDLCEREPWRVHAMLQRLARDLESGELPALPVSVFPDARAIDAFRTMAQTRHIGKLALSFEAARGEQPRAVLPLNGAATYLVTGGLGALGLLVAEWMVERGARSLVLVGRHAAASPDTDARLERLRRNGAGLAVWSVDLSSRPATDALFARIDSELPPLAGIVHAAGVIDDGPVVQQTPGRLARVLSPKVAGTWHLHEATKALPLDFFVSFASVAGLLGWAGQSGYAAGNAFLDALAWWRAARGLPAASIDWGTWSTSGMAASLATAHHERFRRWGLQPIEEAQGLNALRARAGLRLPPARGGRGGLAPVCGDVG